jgi:hypothetical protein
MKSQQKNDPNSWPVVACETTDIFLGTFDHDCRSALTEEQRIWPVVACEDVGSILLDRSDSTREMQSPTPRNANPTT